MIAATVENAGLDVRAAALALADDIAAAEPELELPIEVGEVERARAERAKKLGRPPGKANRGTIQLRNWLLEQGVLPQKAIMSWVAGGPDALLTWVLEGTGPESLDPKDRVAIRRDVMGLWLKSTGELGRYFLAPLAPTDETGRSVPQLVMVMPQAEVGGRVIEAGTAPWDADPARLSEAEKAAAEQWVDQDAGSGPRSGDPQTEE